MTEAAEQVEAPSDNRDTIEAFKVLLRDKEWRMDNLYLILNKQKQVQVFHPRSEQLRFYRDRKRRNFIPKSRQYGVSTAVLIDYLDDCIWAKKGNPVHAAHVDFREDDAKAKLEIARFAWVNGPNHPNPMIADMWRKLHARNPLVTDNKGELRWTNGSKQQASTTFMGGTPTRLHISEFGPLAAQFPDRAERIKRDTIPSVPSTGIIDIETTMQGGTFGVCYDIFKLAMDMVGQILGPLDWWMFFIPWWRDPDCDLPGEEPQKDKTKEYFRQLKITDGVELPLSRQAWYEKKWAELKSDMWTQFPSVLRECLMIGSGMAYFDHDGLLYQQSYKVANEVNIFYGDITVQGDIKDYATRFARFDRRAKEISPYRFLELPEPGECYLLWADACVGKQAEGSNAKRDTHAYGVIKAGRIDPKTGEVRLPVMVACCQSEDRCITTEFIRRIVNLSILYGDCTVAPEINNKDDIAPRLIAAGVRNMWVQGRVGADGAMPGTKKTDEVYGWLTTEGTRRQMLDNMREMTMQHQWRAIFDDIVQQMGVFIVNEKGRAEAAPGEHDDFVTGPAIGLFLLPAAKKYLGGDDRMMKRYQFERAEIDADPAGI